MNIMLAAKPDKVKKPCFFIVLHLFAELLRTALRTENQRPHSAENIDGRVKCAFMFFIKSATGELWGRLRRCKAIKLSVETQPGGRFLCVRRSKNKLCLYQVGRGKKQGVAVLDKMQNLTVFAGGRRLLRRSGRSRGVLIIAEFVILIQPMIVFRTVTVIGAVRL